MTSIQPTYVENRVQPSVTEVFLSLAADREVQGVQLAFETTGDIRVTGVTGLAEGLEVFSSFEDNRLKVGLLDMMGQNMLAAGRTDVLRIEYEGDGEIRLLNAIAVDTRSNEMSVSISTSKRELTLPESYSLSQNIPNPFNPETMISYSLRSASQVKLIVYNVTGQEVATLVDEYKPAGSHTVRWRGLSDSGTQAASGIYLYRLEANDFSETKKMLLLK